MITMICNTLKFSDLNLLSARYNLKVFLFRLSLWMFLHVFSPGRGIGALPGLYVKKSFLHNFSCTPLCRSVLLFFLLIPVG